MNYFNAFGTNDIRNLCLQIVYHICTKSVEVPQESGRLYP